MVGIQSIQTLFTEKDPGVNLKIKYGVLTSVVLFLRPSILKAVPFVKVSLETYNTFPYGQKC